MHLPPLPAPTSPQSPLLQVPPSLPAAMKGDWDDPLSVWDEFFWDAPDLPQKTTGRRKKTDPRTMASNPTPDNNDVLRALADHLADGCHVYEAPLGIKQNKEADIRANIAALQGAALQVGLKKKAVDDAYTVITATDDAGLTRLTDCKLRLAKVLGQRWNAAWAATGFPGQSTAVPGTMDARFTLLDSLKAYFTAMPASESVDAGATAALCLADWTAISDARQVLGAADSAQATALTNRTAAEEALRKRVRGLINELEQLMDDHDPRWEEFGLNVPGNPSSPQAVASVTLEAMSNHRVGVSWPYAVRAIRYRIETLIVGVDTEFQGRGSFKDLEAILKGFTAGQVVKVRVIAGNDGGDAAPSPEAQVVVG